MVKRRDYWLYGLMQSTAWWILFCAACMFVEDFDGKILLRRLVIGLCISAVGTFLIGGLEMWRRRGNDTDVATLWNHWLVGLVQSVAVVLLVMILRGVHGISAGSWVAASAFTLGAGTLVLGSIERWRRRNLKSKTYGN